MRKEILYKFYKRLYEFLQLYIHFFITVIILICVFELYE